MALPLELLEKIGLHSLNSWRRLLFSIPYFSRLSSKKARLIFSEGLYEKILSSVKRGDNLFLSGPGGTGKSHTIIQLYKELKKSKRVAILSTTGISAVSLTEGGVDARTIHSWGGLGILNSSVEYLVKKILSTKRLKDNWTFVEIIILDEISMFGCNALEKIDEIAKAVRSCNLPFGGIQVIFSGDLLQLSPVNDDYAFVSDIWDDLNLKVFSFFSGYRYTDPNWFDMLLRFRKGICTKEDESLLLSRRKTCINKVKPTKLESKKAAVEHFNEGELLRLPGPKKICFASDSCSRENVRKALDLVAAPCVCLKVGAQVMLKVNLDIPNGLCNGTRGVVTAFYDDIVEIQTIKGKKHLIEPYIWTVKVEKEYHTREQTPLVLAWVVTIHKTQGLTLDCVECGIGNEIFCEGQAYVALSRVRELEGLYLTQFNKNKLRASKLCLDYFKNVEYQN